MSVTINLWHVVWGVLAYLSVGVLLYVPLNAIALTKVPDPRARERMRRAMLDPRRFLVQVVAWPLSIAEERGWI